MQAFCGVRLRAHASLPLLDTFRAHCAGNTSLSAVNVGDITQQNLLNDLDAAYILLPIVRCMHL